MSSGRLFQMLGPETEKARVPTVDNTTGGMWGLEVTTGLAEAIAAYYWIYNWCHLWAVCLSVCLAARYLKNAAARITKLHTEMFHHESGKPIIFGSKTKVTRLRKLLPFIIELVLVYKNRSAPIWSTVD